MKTQWLRHSNNCQTFCVALHTLEKPWNFQKWLSKKIRKIQLCMSSQHVLLSSWRSLTNVFSTTKRPLRSTQPRHSRTSAILDQPTTVWESMRTTPSILIRPSPTAKSLWHRILSTLMLWSTWDQYINSKTKSKTLTKCLRKPMLVILETLEPS